MKLPLSAHSVLVLLDLLRRLDELGVRPVLVGGLVPPLLLEALDPDECADLPTPRHTGDCDVAIDVSVSEPNKWQTVEALLAELQLTRRSKQNQFRWEHACGLKLDLMPVPAGIERGDPAAIDFARTFIESDTSTFFRGYELALTQYQEIVVEREAGERQTLRIAGLAAMLAMKLQAWTDRPYERKKDAQDIGWMLRHLRTEIVVDQLLLARTSRAELVAEVIRRLEENFSNADEHRGISHYASQAHGLDDRVTERHRNAVALAVTEVVASYRQRA